MSPARFTRQRVILAALALLLLSPIAGFSVGAVVDLWLGFAASADVAFAVMGGGLALNLPLAGAFVHQQRGRRWTPRDARVLVQLVLTGVTGVILVVFAAT